MIMRKDLSGGEEGIRVRARKCCCICSCGYRKEYHCELCGRHPVCDDCIVDWSIGQCLVCHHAWDRSQVRGMTTVFMEWMLRVRDLKTELQPDEELTARLCCYSSPLL